ncbi:MAG: IS982 family transposase [Acidobacteriota bacterium]|nr:IS982 family transposase [Acidobacteriota bacterium]
MERDIFIISVYCLVVEIMQNIENNYNLRQKGFPPKLTDPEVITIEICGEFFKLHEDTEIYNYFKRHYLHFFPNLPSRTTFVRQSANLWQVKVLCQSILVSRAGQNNDAVQSIDTLPLPVCTWTRGGRRDKRFATLADYGHCAAKNLDYYGFKLGLRISRAGMITHFPLLSARAHDINHLGILIEGFCGTVPADKGFLDEYQQQLWFDIQQTQVITPLRSNMETSPEQVKLVKKTRYWRKLVETVGSQLTERFQIAKIKVKDLWHYQNRIFRKILSHTVGVFLNLQNGNKAVQLALLADF